MANRPSLSISDLPPSVRKKLREQGVKKQRRVTMTKDAVRSSAIRVLAAVADLTAQERRRVLAHATKMNGL